MTTIATSGMIFRAGTAVEATRQVTPGQWGVRRGERGVVVRMGRATVDVAFEGRTVRLAVSTVAEYVREVR